MTHLFPNIAVPILAALLLACSTPPVKSEDALQQMAAKPIADKPYAGEDRNWDLFPVDKLRTGDYHAPTPTTIPGARVVTTYTLHDWLVSGKKLLLANVLNGTGETLESIPTSVWLNGAGIGGEFNDQYQNFLGGKLAALTQGDKSRTLVFYCLSVECWLSYNTALRAARLGYRDVYWYRGGIESWEAAGLPVVPVRASN
jgi:PQQ-dependent catabolism-associated CXXCW motif protein